MRNTPQSFNATVGLCWTLPICPCLSDTGDTTTGTQFHHWCDLNSTEPPSTYLQVYLSHQDSWTYLCPVGISVPWPDHPFACFFLQTLPGLWALGLLKASLVSKVWDKRGIKYSHFAMSNLSQTPMSFSTKPTFLLAFLLSLCTLKSL